MPLPSADLTPDDEKPAAEVVAEGLAGEIGVPAPVRRTPADSLAFVLSAVLSPYLVIPFGTLGIIYARSRSGDPFWLWAAISIFFSTALPVIYVLIGMARGTISDVHVMERNQRGGPFAVAILGGFLAAYVLHRLHAPPSVWGLSLLLSINGLVIGIITTFTKISVHVSVLSSTVLCAVLLHTEINPYWLLWTIPALIWARTKRGRHSAWQGIGGALVATIVTGFALMMLGLGDRIGLFFERAF